MSVMDSLRASSLGPNICHEKISFGGSIRGSIKSHRLRSLQIMAACHHSSPSIHVTNPRSHKANEQPRNGSENLGKGASLLDSISGRKKPWWSPIFKFSSDHDSDRSKAAAASESADLAVSKVDGKSRKATVLFTEEKARVLRREMRAMESWHDLMYHSAIASRMAFPDDDSSSR